MTHRAPLLELLDRYDSLWPGEVATARISELVRSHHDCLLRTCLPGHVTSSAWILSPDHQRCLLTHHRKLDRWLQLGGHVDGEPRVELAALREAREESGMQQFELCLTDDLLVPLDLDVHPIPARGADPQHDHHDVRFLLIAGRDLELIVSDESHELAWVPRSELRRYTDEDSVLRLADKADRLLRR